MSDFELHFLGGLFLSADSMTNGERIPGYTYSVFFLILCFWNYVILSGLVSYFVLSVLTFFRSSKHR